MFRGTWPLSLSFRSSGTVLRFRTSGTLSADLTLDRLVLEDELRLNGFGRVSVARRSFLGWLLGPDFDEVLGLAV